MELSDNADAVQRWQTWSHGWEQRLEDLGDRCRLDAPDERGQPAFAGRHELAAARDAVLQLHRAYSVQVNRFAQDEANLARAAADALKTAQSAVTRASAGR
jgi:hypothetical protein